MKVSLLITAWKEEKTIGKCIQTLISGYEGDFELILGCPDIGTLEAARATCRNLNIENKLIHVLDPGKGKPLALNMMMDKASGEIWVFGDGDVYYGENTINNLLAKFNNSEVMAVTGHPVSSDERDTMMGYFGHLLTAAAHHKRMIDLGDAPGHGRTFVKKRPFFPVSGYLFAMRASEIRPPEDTLVEDAYISYTIHQNGGKIAYANNALVYVKFPTTLDDYFKQKKRSVGGYVQLWKYGFVNKDNNTRSLSRELEYFWFPIKFAKTYRELLWSLTLYPIRLWLWLQIFWERKIRHKSFMDTWVRVESTK